jgi:hypothetical protein
LKDSFSVDAACFLFVRSSTYSATVTFCDFVALEDSLSVDATRFLGFVAGPVGAAPLQT